MPEMSVIILTPDGYAAIRRLMAHLCAQTARDRLELVLVAPQLDALQADEGELAGFAAVRLVEADVLRSSAEARAAGVRAATAPIVVFTEDHSLPEPAWAESLIRAHGEAWAVVGPAVINANPRGAVSWANLLIEYIEWLHLDYALVDFFYIDKLLKAGGLVVFDDLWLPAIRRVVSFVLRERNYALQRVRSEQRRPFWRPAASATLRALQDPLGFDLRVAAIPQNIAVLRKLSEDTRSWRMRRRLRVS
jgi:hypothetical protein